MKKIIHRNEDRGEGDYGWLKTRYSFSFADWHDPSRMGFGVLRVINDDRVAPGKGFDTHGHRDMEIITIVTEGVLKHKDSIGNAGIIPEGDVQVMSAGTGVQHSEYNASDKDWLALFQIWIESSKHGVTPRYDQRSFAAKANEFQLLVSGDQSSDVLFIHQDAHIYRGVFDAGKKIEYSFQAKSRGAYIFVINGDIQIKDDRLGTRDAVGIWDAEKISIDVIEKSMILVIDVHMMV